MAFRIRPIRRSRTCTVVFTATVQEVAGIDVAIGPCVERVGPRGGRVRPIVSPWDQLRDRYDNLERLFEIVVPGTRGQLSVERLRAGRGTLDTLNSDFVTALVEVDPASDHVQRAWLDVADWPSDQQLGGLTMRLLNYTAKARGARKRGQHLYCWSGPELPFLGIASGKTQQDYDEYRRSIARR